MASTSVLSARPKLLKAALRVISSQINEDMHADYAFEAEYADDQLAIAARDLVRATNALDPRDWPVGWTDQC
jgi:hypothetical protein